MGVVLDVIDLSSIWALPETGFLAENLRNGTRHLDRNPVSPEPCPEDEADRPGFEGVFGGEGGEEQGDKGTDILARRRFEFRRENF
ncbi:MAG: hypothetical protein Fur0025_01290 [Oscillatoriaceae cyanobacterium]